jgi:hypothetical protein
MPLTFFKFFNEYLNSIQVRIQEKLSEAKKQGAMVALNDIKNIVYNVDDITKALTLLKFRLEKENNTQNQDWQTGYSIVARIVLSFVNDFLEMIREENGGSYVFNNGNLLK